MASLRPLIACTVALSLTALGCKKDGANEEGTAAATSAPTKLPTKFIESSLTAVAGDAAVVVTIALPYTVNDLVTGAGFVPLDPSIADELRKALANHVKKHIGLDFGDTQTFVLFGAGPDEESGAAILAPVGGSLKEPAGELAGSPYAILEEEGDVEIVVAHKGQSLIIGSKDSVEAAAAALGGSGDALSKANPELASLVASQSKNAYFSASGDLRKLPLPPTPFTDKLETASVMIGPGTGKVIVQGAPEGLELIASQLEAGLQLATSMAKAEMEQNADKLAEGAAGIVGYYMAKGITEMIEPKIEGDRLSLDLPLFSQGAGGGAMFVTVTGVLAAVAIPAFMKYIKKSKTSEAKMMLRRLDMGATELIASGQALPTSVGPTPDPLSCFHGGSEKHAVDSTLWAHPSWQALQFSMNDEHYYSYQFINKGDQYELRAYGDLDCDGELSTFTLIGGTADGSGPSVYSENELE